MPSDSMLSLVKSARPPVDVLGNQPYLPYMPDEQRLSRLVQQELDDLILAGEITWCCSSPIRSMKPGRRSARDVQGSIPEPYARKWPNVLPLTRWPFWAAAWRRHHQAEG